VEIGFLDTIPCVFNILLDLFFAAVRCAHDVICDSLSPRICARLRDSGHINPCSR
jgi:hypothetical protein